MPYHLIIDGVPIYCDTTREARALAAELAGNSAQAKSKGAHPQGEKGKLGRKPSRDREAEKLERAKHLRERAVKYLSTIKSAGTEGIDSDGLVFSLNLQTRDALGGEALVANKELMKLSIEKDAAYTTELLNGVRKWIPQKGIGDAIKRLRDAAD